MVCGLSACTFFLRAAGVVVTVMEVFMNNLPGKQQEMGMSNKVGHSLAFFMLLCCLNSSPVVQPVNRAEGYCLVQAGSSADGPSSLLL